MRNLITLAALLAIAAGIYVYTRTAPESARADEPGAYGFAPGELVEDFSAVDVSGTTRRLSDIDAEAIVLVVRDSQCPVSQRYGPKLARLEAEYAERGVEFVFINMSVQDDPDEMREDAERFNFTGWYLDDSDQAVGRLLRTTTTAEVFVIDRARTLRYRGAVDDQYGITFTKPEPREHWLRDALEDVLNGEPVATPQTVAEGCHLGLDDEPVHVARDITYHNRISRVIQENCQTCHRTEGVAPIAFESYEDVYGMRSMIEYVLTEGIMPPWFADSSVGKFANDRSLDPRDRRDLLAWIQNGAPEGDAQHAPLARAWSGKWKIGKPDAIIQLEEAIPVPAEGVVDYKYVYVKTNFPEDKWIQRMEIRPTAPTVTHHVLVFIEPPGAKGPRDAQPGEPVFQGGIDGFFAGTVPGSDGNWFPEGMAKKLPAGAWLKFQLHYTPNGVATTDQTQLAFVFADEEPAREVNTGSAFNARFEIPPGAPRHEVAGEYTFEQDAEILTFFPHMHVRGVAFKIDLLYPDGRLEPVLNVPRYDFNWQLFYANAEPLRVPAGTTVRATGWFDNSEGNPFNPDPSRTVRFGEQTFDEMMIGYFDWIPAADPVTSGGASR